MLAIQIKSWFIRIALGLAMGTLSACGGGAEFYIEEDASLSINAYVEAEPVQGSVLAGESRSLTIFVGESLEFESNEPVDWQFLINGQAIVGAGNSVYYGGLVIQQGFLSNTIWSASTSTDTGLMFAVNFTVVARSKIDPSQSIVIEVTVVE